jgi:hypothetical protein
MYNRLMKPLLIIMVLVLAAGAACGHQTGAAAAERSSVPARIQAWEREIDRLHDLIGGSPRERAAGDLVLFHRNQDPVTACMRARGIDYSPAPWADEWRLRDSRGMGTGSSLFLEPIDDPDYFVRVERGEALAQRETGRGERSADHTYDSLDSAARARWDAAIKACQRGAEETTEGWHPAAGYGSLLTAFGGLLARGDAAAAPHARGYGRCMRRAGVDADNASVLPDALIPSFPPEQAPPKGPGGPQFQRWVARVHHAMSADARCRRTAFLAGWRVLGPQIAPWERAHAGAIAALHRRWEAMVAKAEGEAGWDWPSGVTDRS